MDPPERELVTDINKSPLIQILAWMFLVVAVLACIARTGTKLYMIKRLKTEDWFAVVATVCSGSTSHLIHGNLTWDTDRSLWTIHSPCRQRLPRPRQTHRSAYIKPHQWRTQGDYIAFNLLVMCLMKVRVNMRPMSCSSAACSAPKLRRR